MIITFRGEDLHEIDSIYHCGTSRKYCYLDCYQIREALVIMMDNYEFKLNSTNDITKKGNESILIDVISYETKFNTKETFPGCREFQSEENKHPDGVHTGIRNWIDFMSDKDFDPFWVRNCEEEIAQPFNAKIPKVDIRVPYLNDRNFVNEGSVEIYAQNDKLIFRGRMENGKIEDKIYVPSGIHLLWFNFQNCCITFP